MQTTTTFRNDTTYILLQDAGQLTAGTPVVVLWRGVQPNGDPCWRVGDANCHDTDAFILSASAIAALCWVPEKWSAA